ncbi:MAG: DUF3365 domain-containing protein [Rhodocyclaceae bacterium]|nr:DUF3365 domain-containing protein [Rhodocyclaceae bacterium]
MNRIALLLAAALAALPALADEAKLLEEARAVATSIPPKLLEVLNAEIAKGGPESAIGVCREKAPQMARAASEKTGWAIRRVSLKNRNPKAVPDAWEKTALEDFDRRAAGGGEKPTGMEKGEIVADGGARTFRYMKALPTQDICMDCHGMTERISPAVKARINEFYPDDKAVGYGPAEIRGAITLKKTL